MVNLDMEDVIVRPEQLINLVGKIKYQMNYVPKNYIHNKSSIKTILLYNGRGYDWEMIQTDQSNFIDCPVSQCSFTIDQSLGHKADVILFKHKYTRPPFERPMNQVSL